MVRMKPLGRVVLLAGLAHGLACSPAPVADRSVGKAKMITLYEGLPHPSYEKSYEAEKAGSRPIIERGEYSFYEEPLRLSLEEQASLEQVLGDKATYYKFAGEKKCGGFHPDYAVEWEDDGRMRTTMICFTCSEFKVRGPDGERRYDIARPAQEPLARLLKGRRKNRPEITNRGG